MSDPRATAPATVVASAPGKAILIGEHAAVYGRPALVAALDRRLEVRLSAVAGDPGVHLRLPQIGVDRRVGWDDVERYADAARQRWQAYRDRPGAAAFAALRGDDPAHVVLVAIGEAIRELDLAPRALRLEGASAIPVGAGFGSSAAAAVATVVAMARIAGRDLDRDATVALAQRAEERQHGRPSGVDATVVTHGGVLWCERDLAADPPRLRSTPVAATARHLERIRLVHTGTPAEATGAVVAAVADRLTADPALAAALDRMEAATRALAAAIAAAADDPERVVAELVAFERELERLGVVPAPVQRLVRRVEAAGGAAKVSGAGSLAGPGAGSLLVYHPDPRALDDPALLVDDGLDLEVLDAGLGGEGARIDTP